MNFKILTILPWVLSADIVFIRPLRLQSELLFLIAPKEMKSIVLICTTTTTTTTSMYHYYFYYYFYNQLLWKRVCVEHNVCVVNNVCVVREAIL